MKPGVFIEAGVHGREWITPAVATWILKELVKVNATGESCYANDNSIDNNNYDMKIPFLMRTHFFRRQQ